MNSAITVGHNANTPNAPKGQRGYVNDDIPDWAARDVCCASQTLRRAAEVEYRTGRSPPHVALPRHDTSRHQDEKS